MCARPTKTATSPERPLPTGYYADNAAILIRTVERRYGDLLRPEEQAFADTFHGLSTDARRLWVRLVSRRGPAVRRDRVRYDEIGDVDGAIDALTGAGFADRAEDAEPATLLPLMLRGELVALARANDLGVAGGLRKGELIATLAAQLPTETLDQALRTALPVVRARKRGMLLVYRLLFFGNTYQDWTELLLRDLGVVRYEPYSLDRSLRLFPDRQAIDDTLVVRELRAAVELALRAGALDQARTLAAPLTERTRWHPITHRRLDRILNHVGRAFERAKRFDDALACYAGAESPPARERQVRILAKTGAIGRALRLCRAIEEAPRDETERSFAARFAVRLKRKCGDRIPALRRPKRPTRTLEVTAPDPGADVETVALDALRAEGMDGFFAENWLWLSLFGLVFWDIVFAPVEGAFEHPYQSAPRDLHRPRFRDARADSIDARLEALRGGTVDPAAVLARWHAKHGTTNRLVSWHPSTPQALAQALERLDGEHLAWVFDRLSRDIGRYRRGFPDLFVRCDEAPGFALVEVKGPGDQLRPEQGGWIDHLNAGGLPASVLRLVWV